MSDYCPWATEKVCYWEEKNPVKRKTKASTLPVNLSTCNSQTVCMYFYIITVVGVFIRLQQFKQCLI